MASSRYYPLIHGECRRTRKNICQENRAIFIFCARSHGFGNIKHVQAGDERRLTLQLFDFPAGSDFYAFFREDFRGLVGIFEPENQYRVVAELLDEAVPILDVYIVVAEYLEDLRESARLFVKSKKFF